VTITTEQLNLFKLLFKGRQDCYGAESGNIKEELTDSIITQHLVGQRRIGVYMMLIDSTYFACVDVDRKDREPVAIEDTKEILNTSQSYGLSGYIERSKSKGYHIWYFFSDLVQASKIRAILKQIHYESGISEPIEIFPKQDSVADGEYGNFINLPVFKKDVANGKTAFLDPSSWTPHHDQWQFLSQIKKISPLEIDSIISKNNISIEPKRTNYHKVETPIQRTPKDTDDMINEFITRAINEAGTKGRNDSGYDLASQLRDHDVPELEAESVMQRYQSQVSDTKDHDYTIQEAMASLKSAYKEPKRESWWKPKPKSLSGSGDRYDPGENHTNTDTSGMGDPVSEKTEAEKKVSKYYYKDENGRQAFSHGKLAEELMSEYDFVCVDGILYIYLNGVYKAIGDDYVDSICQKRLGYSARNSRIKEVVSYIKRVKRTESDSLNTHKFLINLNNGMYDITNEKLLQHSKNYLSTIRIPVNYDSSVSYSVISDWLASTLCDPECIQLACELFGYCLIPDTTMAKAFMLVGSGANGKSTFLTVLENFIGKDNVSKVPLQELSDHRFKRAELFGKLVNLFADLDNRALESTTYFKTIVTGDSIDAERKNQNPFSFRPYTRLVFSANEIPRSRDRSFAYYRRWCIIPFERQFMGADDKKGLAEELSKPENLSALLNCALSELKNVMKRQSFSEPEKIKNALNEYEKQNDPVKAFVDECCQLDPYARIERGSLYTAFCQYCDDTGFKSVTNRNFYQRLRIFREIKELTDSDGKRQFQGIKLLIG
jgi:putative DNA primase/helicase